MRRTAKQIPTTPVSTPTIYLLLGAIVVWLGYTWWWRPAFLLGAPAILVLIIVVVRPKNTTPVPPILRIVEPPGSSWARGRTHLHQLEKRWRLIRFGVFAATWIACPISAAIWSLWPLAVGLLMSGFFWLLSKSQKKKLLVEAARFQTEQGY